MTLLMHLMYLMYALYSLRDDAPDDGLVIVRNM